MGLIGMEGWYGETSVKSSIVEGAMIGARGNGLKKILNVQV
jgi:hypothetical protein